MQKERREMQQAATKAQTSNGEDGVPLAHRLESDDLDAIRAPEPPDVPVIRTLKLLTPVVITPPALPADAPKGQAGLSSRTAQNSVTPKDGWLFRIDWTSRVVWLGWTYDVPYGATVTAWAWTPFENVQFACVECEP